MGVLASRILVIVFTLNARSEFAAGWGSASTSSFILRFRPLCI